MDMTVTPENAQPLLDWLAANAKAYFDVHLKNLTPPTFSISFGKVNAKIVSNSRSQNAVWGFVEIKTGKIMKAGSANAPEPKKHDRGNIHRPEGWPTQLNYISPNYR